MDKNYLVNKSNSLITANYDLSLQEQKLILTLASTVQPNDEDFKEYEFKIKDFMDLLEIKNNSGYTEIKQMTKNLMRKVFEIREGRDTVQMAWFSSVRYREGEGIVILKFDNCLKPYLLQLKEFYTSYKLENILSLKSKYALRLYEIMKSNQFRKTFEIELAEFKRILGITEKSYSVYQNVKNKVILQAQKELNTKTDISFDFEEIKTGRKVTSLKFLIKSNAKVNAPKEKAPINEVSADIDNNVSKLVELMKDNKLTYGEAESIYKSGNADLMHIVEVYEHFKNKQADNFVGLMIAQVKPGVFNKPKQNQNTTSFNNFEPRQYDYDALEKKLLGWEDEKDINGNEYEQLTVKE